MLLVLTHPWQGQGINTGGGGGLGVGSVTMHEDVAEQEVQFRGRQAESLYAIFTQAWVHCNNKTLQILFTNMTWYLQFSPVNVGILRLRGEYGARSKICLALSSHCYVAWCPLTEGALYPWRATSHL